MGYTNFKTTLPKLFVSHPSRSHAEKCPVCNGRGQLEPTGYTTDNSTRTCHGCNGKGWVVVSD